MDDSATLARSIDRRAKLVEWPDRPAGTAVRVLEDDTSARPEVGIVLRPHVVRRDASLLARHAAHDQAGVDRRSAPLVDEDVRALLGEEYAARLRLGPESRLIRHRRGRKKERHFMAEQ